MLKRTPLFEIHKKYGARLIDFGGFEMPVQYSSIKEEHKAVRNSVGMFDISHMGEFFVRGAEAIDLIQTISVNDASKLVDGKAQYTTMCYEDGGIVDDLLIYRIDNEEFMLVVNAANRTKDWEWILEHNDFDAELENASDDMCLLAIQGPRAVETLQKLTDTNLQSIGFYTFETGTLAGYDDIMLSATGYTGEAGFELYFDKNEAEPEDIWEQIMQAGEEFDIKPAGLGARDTLRLEMGFALYGNDITAETNPIEAGLGWLTKIDAKDFIGKKAIQNIKEEGTDRKLKGFKIKDARAIPRKGYFITDKDGNTIGKVTSGSMSITLGKGIGMGYIEAEHADEGTTVYIEIRNKLVEAEVVRPPFIKKNK